MQRKSDKGVKSFIIII